MGCFFYGYAEEIIQAGEKAKDLIYKLLAFSKKESISYEKININELIKDFNSLVQSSIRKNIAVQLELNDKKTVIYGDKGQLEQIILNLVLNAQDAILSTGKIIITTKIVDKTVVELLQNDDITSNEMFCLLSVRDNGFGMDEELKRKIFDPFFSTKGDNGHGLGLSTIFGIVKQLKGYIFVDSEESIGSEFKIYLPYVDLD